MCPELAVPLLLRSIAALPPPARSWTRVRSLRRDPDDVASQAALAIENARLAGEIERARRESRFAKRAGGAAVNAAPRRVKGIDLAAPPASARELGGTSRLLLPD